MPLSLQRLIEARPVLYHLTARQNCAGILGGGPEGARLWSALELLRASGDMGSAARVRRKGHLAISVPSGADGERTKVLLRDQDPLHAGNIALKGGFTFEDLLESLNARVFFWPGAHEGPSDYGVRHFARYRREGCVVLVVGFAELLAANPGAVPLLSACNSGSPRCNPKVPGRKAPRGPATFLPPADFELGVGRVVEVTFEGSVRLPATVKVEQNVDRLLAGVPA